MTVGLVQINNSFSGQNYLPLSVGLLQAYAQQHLTQPARYAFLLPLYSRRPVGEAVEHLQAADIVFFSTYVWNIRMSLEIARQLKARRPQIVTVMGGPQVPNDAEEFHARYPFVDVTCHGEGEIAAAALLEQLPTRSWGHVPSVSYRTAEGPVARTPRAPRIADLNTIPSPYLAGVFDPLIQAHPEEHWIALWETNRGCPFSCTFCDWGSATQARVYTFGLERLYQEVRWFADHRIEFLFCCDANYGMLPRDLEIAEYVAETKRTLRYPHVFSVQNTKNATERAYRVQQVLSDAGMSKGVAIALQSMDAETLRHIRRDNISLESYQELQRRFTRDRVETYTDMILGLPGETYESFADGVSAIIENGQHNRIQFNNLGILPNAEMGDPAYQRRYGMIFVEAPIINVHGSLTETGGEEVPERQVLVVGTNTMPPEEWVRTRAFSWMAALLHFDKLLQIPFVLLHTVCGIRYRAIIEAFSEGPLPAFPVLAGLQAFLQDKARAIQRGDPEYCPSKAWLNMWWPADEYLLISLCVNQQLGAFYDEARRRLTQLLQELGLQMPEGLLEEALAFNQGLMKLPFQTEDVVLRCRYNLWDYYQGLLVRAPVPLVASPNASHIDRTSKTWTSWDAWCREVIWYGHRRGAYFYGNNGVESELAGHH